MKCLSAFCSEVPALVLCRTVLHGIVLYVLASVSWLSSQTCAPGSSALAGSCIALNQTLFHLAQGICLPETHLHTLLYPGLPSSSRSPSGFVWLFSLVSKSSSLLSLLDTSMIDNGPTGWGEEPLVHTAMAPWYSPHGFGLSNRQGWPATLMEPQLLRLLYCVLVSPAACVTRSTIVSCCCSATHQPDNSLSQV